MVRNLYVHFPFCRRKCSYCALHSRVGQSEDGRHAYVARLASAVREADGLGAGSLSTVYFGGGSPALCDLRPLLSALAPRLSSDCEFTVELHPLDVTADLLTALRDGGVNRISMGVQSLDDAVLADMGRGHSADQAERAFGLVRDRFDNAGIDLIVGYPGDASGDGEWRTGLERLRGWGLRHCSVYSLILEEKSILRRRLRKQAAESGRMLTDLLPSDDETMDRLGEVACFLAGLGLERYEISNYAIPGCECRHNLAVWRGEDYYGLGEGAFGRLGLTRTRDCFTLSPSPVSRQPTSAVVETVTPEADARERTLFRLRTREGLDTSRYPAWRSSLDVFAKEGLLTRDGLVYRLTSRGMEVCDSILAEIV